MCLICLKCGKCPGIASSSDKADIRSHALLCLKCGHEIPDGSCDCPQCGAKALVPPGSSSKAFA